MKFIAIANNGSKVATAISDLETKTAMVGEAECFTANANHRGLDNATAELSELEGTLQYLVSEGYKGEVIGSFHFGLALKLNLAVSGQEIFQTSWMPTAEGNWKEYCDRIKNLAAYAKENGLFLEAHPSTSLWNARVDKEIEENAEIVDKETIRINGVEYKNGQTVTFSEVTGDNYPKKAGELVIHDYYVVGERKLDIRMPRTENGRVAIMVERFPQGLPKTNYGGKISWLRKTMDVAFSKLTIQFCDELEVVSA